MQNTEFPEVKERMETHLCCAHNASNGSSISSRIAVADLAIQPLKALKMLMDGLATDGTTGLWLRSLLGPPLMMHLFPFDFVYLDADQRVIEAVELFPNMPFPRSDAAVTSALFLPLRTLASTGTKKGDQLIICAHEELDLRLEAIATREELSVVEAPEDLASIAAPVGEKSGEGAPPQADFQPEPAPRGEPQTQPVLEQPVEQRIPIHASTVSAGAGFTVSLATTWQVSSTTMPAAIRPEENTAPEAISIVEAPEEEIATEKPKAMPGAGVAEPESAVESTDAEADTEQGAKIEATTLREPGSAIELVARTESEPASTVEPDAKSEYVLIANRLSDVVAAAEAAAIVELEPPVEEEDRITDERIARSKAAWEKTSAKTTRPAPAGPAKAKKKAPDPKKDPLGTRVIRWLNLEDPLPERRKIIRLLLEGLQAYETNGDRSKRYEIRDVCPTGFCLRTQKKWKPGQLVSLMLEKKGTSEKDRIHRVRIRARVVRCDEDGAGLEFVFPKGTEFEPWKRAKTKQADETEADFILRELRLSNALGFLRRLCPGGAEEVRHALYDRLSNKRVACAVDIALLAEETLARGGQANLASAHTGMVMRVLESGSWNEDGWIRKLWAGLLVSSCAADGQDTSNKPFIDLLAKLTPLHLRIMSFVCSKGAEMITAGRSGKELYVDYTPEQLMDASDSHSFARIQQTIAHLSNHGLFAETAQPSYVTLTDKAKTRLAPTALGLKMWARCNGQKA